MTSLGEGYDVVPCVQTCSCVCCQDDGKGLHPHGIDFVVIYCGSSDGCTCMLQRLITSSYLLFPCVAEALIGQARP